MHYFCEKCLEEDLAHSNDCVTVNNDSVLLSPPPPSLPALRDTLWGTVTAVHT